MYCIDAHTHPFAEDFADNGRRLLKEMDHHGVALLIMSNIGPYTTFPSAAEIESFNRAARTLCEAHPHRLYYLVYLNPLEANWREVLQEHRDSRQALGIKLWVSLKDSNGSLQPTRAVLAAAAESNFPVLLHVYERTDARLSGEIGLTEFTALAQEFSPLPMLGAHAGGNWREGVAWRRQLPPQTYLDICGGFPEQGMLEALVADGFERRIIFGSDACGRSFASQLSKVTLAAVPAAIKQAVLVQNAADFFGLSEQQVTAAVRALRLSAGVGATVAPRALPLPTPPCDHFCFAGKWPLAKHGSGTLSALVQAMRRAGYGSAYVANCDGLLSHDLPVTQVSWLRQATAYSQLRPLLTVNPFSQASLNTLACGEAFAGVWISPYFHNFALTDSALLLLLEKWATAGLKVWINLGAGDHRMRPRNVGVRPVSVDEFGEFCRTVAPGCYVVQGGNMSLLKHAEAKKRLDIFFTAEFISDNQRPAMWQERCQQLVWGSEYPLRDSRQALRDIGLMYGYDKVSGRLPE